MPISWGGCQAWGCPQRFPLPSPLAPARPPGPTHPHFPELPVAQLLEQLQGLAGDLPHVFGFDRQVGQFGGPLGARHGQAAAQPGRPLCGTGERQASPRGAPNPRPPPWSPRSAPLPKTHTWGALPPTGDSPAAPQPHFGVMPPPDPGGYLPSPEAGCSLHRGHGRLGTPGGPPPAATSTAPSSSS